MSDATNDLAIALSGGGSTAAGTNSTSLSPAQGVVDAINPDGTLGVVVNGLGSAVPAVCLTSYDPTVGDVVSVLVVNNAVILVLGTLADAQSIGPPLPAGTVIQSVSPTPPLGFLACDGSIISRTTYSRLNAIASALGYPWGDGDGATTFALPNMAGVFVMGAGGNNDIGDSGGTSETLLSSSNLPVHDHTLGAATWSGTVSGGTISGGSISDGEVSDLSLSDVEINGLELSGSGTLSGSTGAGTEHYHTPQFGDNFITDQSSDSTPGEVASGSGVTIPNTLYYGTSTDTSDEDSHTHPLDGESATVGLSEVTVEYSSVTGTISGGTVSGDITGLELSDVDVSGSIGGETDPAGTPASQQSAISTLPPYTVLAYYVKT